ncbi:unnamed protein product [Pylaiella littoralis]
MASSDGISGFDTWLVDKLDALGLDAEVYGGYVTGIMGDEDNPQEERIDSVIEILSGAAEEDTNLDDFRSSLKQRWEVKLGLEQEVEEAAKAAKQKEMDSRKEEERRQVEEADKQRRAKAEKIVMRSAAEKAERDRLLGEYGYDSDPVDEEGNPLPPEEGGDGEGAVGSSAGDSLGEAYGQNLNKERVRQEVAAKRDAIKKTHHATALQNKIALEADKMKKEMAKNARKTTKGERKR